MRQKCTEDHLHEASHFMGLVAFGGGPSEWPQQNVAKAESFHTDTQDVPLPLLSSSTTPKKKKKSIKSSPLVALSGCFQWTRLGRTFNQCFRVSDVCVATSALS